MPARNERHAYGVVLAGLALVFIVYLVAAYKWNDAKDVIGIVASVGGIVGTIVGAYFGVKIGQDKRNELQDENRKLHSKLTRVALEPAAARRIIEEP